MHNLWAWRVVDLLITSQAMHTSAEIASCFFANVKEYFHSQLSIRLLLQWNAAWRCARDATWVACRVLNVMNCDAPAVCCTVYRTPAVIGPCCFRSTNKLCLKWKLVVLFRINIFRRERLQSFRDCCGQWLAHGVVSTSCLRTYAHSFTSYVFRSRNRTYNLTVFFSAFVSKLAWANAEPTKNTVLTIVLGF